MRRITCEVLEGRVFLNAVPVGPDFIVNSTTAGLQDQASIASDRTGAFVVAWRSGPFEAGEVRARLFDADGRPRGDDFRVSAPGETALGPAVAMDNDGDFVVAWGQDDGVHLRRFDSAGIANGAEVLTGDGYAPSIAMNADGDFIVVFKRDGGQFAPIIFQRYNASGQRVDAGTVGGNLPFSQGTGTAAVAMDADGDFTIAWTETTGVTDAYYVRNTGGVWSGTKRVFPLPDQPPGPGRLGVAENAAGQTVITSHTAIGIYATVLDPSGATRGDRIFVSEGFFETDIGGTSVADDGSFIVSFERFGHFYHRPGSARARAFDAGGRALGDEFVLSDRSTDSVSVAPAPAGGFVAVMTEPSPGMAADSPDVYARRFVPAARPPQVDRVYVRGTDWSADFLSYLESTGIGSSRFGYAAGGTPDPLPLPWDNLNQVSISFNGDVAVEPEDLHVTGVQRASYPVAGFEYDRARHVATWRFDGRLPADRLSLTLDTPGLHYAFPLNVVPGDANRDGRTNALDVATVRVHLGTRAHMPGDVGGMDYVRTVDLNGDGRIDALDIAAAKRDLNRSLPRATDLLR